MALGLHNLKLTKNSKRTKRRKGRGAGSGRGNYSGRGMKGQRSRSGGRSGLKLLGLKKFLQHKPKLGGFRSLRPKLAVVNIEKLEVQFSAGEVVNAKSLIAKNLVKDNKAGIKILGQGKLTKSLMVTADAFSKTAKKAIIEAGGKAEIRKQKTK